MSRKPAPLPPAIAALLASERAIAPESDERRQRVFARARRALAAGEASRSPGRALGRWHGGRWMAAVAVGIAGAAAWAAVRDAQKQPPAAPASHAASAAPAQVTSKTEPRVPAAPEAPARAPPPADASPADSVRPPARRIVSTPSPSRRSARDDGYEVELRLLEPARSAMARGDHDAALATLAEHERRFRAGRLAEEREALRIKALLGLGRGDAARATAARFRNAFPTSVLLPSIEEMVKGAP